MPGLLRPALVVFALLSLITGVVYPLAVTGVAAALFPGAARGSIITRNGRAVGSSLIGQDFSSAPRYFWGRLSATSPVPYTAFNAGTATGSTGSNLALGHPALVERATARIEALRAADAAVGLRRPADQQVPVDLVTASGSGLDPHISLAAAEYQVPRVARARGLAEDEVRRRLQGHVQQRFLGVFGEPVVHVLALNLDLDAGR